MEKDLKTKSNKDKTYSYIGSVGTEGRELKKTVSEHRQKIEKVEEDYKCEIRKMEVNNIKRDQRISGVEQLLANNKIQNIQKDIEELKRSLENIKDNQSMKPEEIKKLVQTSIMTLKQEMNNQFELVPQTSGNIQQTTDSRPGIKELLEE